MVQLLFLIQHTFRSKEHNFTDILIFSVLKEKVRMICTYAPLKQTIPVVFFMSLLFQYSLMKRKFFQLFSVFSTFYFKGKGEKRITSGSPRFFFQRSLTRSDYERSFFTRYFLKDHACISCFLSFFTYVIQCQFNRQEALPHTSSVRK